MCRLSAYKVKFTNLIKLHRSFPLYWRFGLKHGGSELYCCWCERCDDAFGNDMYCDGDFLLGVCRLAVKLILISLLSIYFYVMRSPDGGLVAWVIISFIIILFLAVLAQKALYENHLAQRTNFSALHTQLLFSFGFSMLFFLALTGWMAYDGFIFRT